MNNDTITEVIRFRDSFITVIRDEDGTIHSIKVIHGVFLLATDGCSREATVAFASDADGVDIRPFRVGEDAEVEAFEDADADVMIPAAAAGIIGADVLAFWQDS